MSALPDRRVHAILEDHWEVVRYDRAGKWFIEGRGPREGQRHSVTLHMAAKAAVEHGVAVKFNLSGGRLFDHRVLALQEKKT